jgi:hypothetical protein
MTDRLQNIVDNLPLLADFGFASVLLAVPAEGALRVVASHRSTTAVAPMVADLNGTLLDAEVEGEAYAAFAAGEAIVAKSPRERERVSFVPQAHPVFENGKMSNAAPIAVIIRHIALAASENPGRMEAEFSAMATTITRELCIRPLLTIDGQYFSTTRCPGDGILRVDDTGTVVYPSPNAVAIMRRAGFDQRVRTSPVSALPGGGFAVTPVLGIHAALTRETEVLGRVLSYRSIGLGTSAVVFVEDVTETRRQEAELAGRDDIIKEIRAQVQQLSDQLETRKALDRAKAILMERGLSEAQAFSRLQKSAMNHRKSLKEISDAIILSDEMQ